MCRLCLTRRTLLAAPALLPATARAGSLVEPRLRLASPAGLEIALTLDACPGGFDERIAAALADTGARATIMVTALWLRHNPGPLAWLLARPAQFRLENHGARHIPPVLGARPVFGLAPAGTPEAIDREVTEGAAAITAAAGRPPRWYRGATAWYSPAALPRIRALGPAIAGYSLGADQGASLPARSVAARMATARPGDVIIAHINQPRRDSGAGVAEGIRALASKGARFAFLPDDPAATVAG